VGDVGRAAAIALGGALALALGGGERDARACGGCFVPPSESTIVNDHRMAFSISTRQTVLWDQIRYSGNPREFAWILPIHPGARLELSRDEWFAALDATTQPIVTAPPRALGNGGSGGCLGCGTRESAAEFAAGGEPPRVEVINQETIGPYETSTVRSSDPDALRAWLTAHGYAIPDSVAPTIDAYTSEGFDFIALRLQPGASVRAMQPVRIVTDGADLTLPLRMVAAGVGANVGITLYVVGEGRYHPQNFADIAFDETKLVWDYGAGRSNYQDLSETAMRASPGGAGWLTEYANRPSLIRGSGSSGSASSSLIDTYMNACALGFRGVTRPFGDDGGADDAGSTDAASDTSADADATSDAGDAGDADTDAASDAGTPPVACQGASCCDDLDVALTGLHRSDVWVTRLRAILPVAALSKGDLRLEATAAQTIVSNVHHARDPDVPSSTSGRNGSLLSFGGGVLGVVSLLRRRRR
jgi:hypothetical protein